MTDGYELVSGGLEEHGGQLDGLVDRLRQAVDAAKQVSMPTDAYGIVCQPFRMMLDPVEQFGINALQKAVEAMESTAKGIRDTARTYQDIEDNNAQLFQGGQG
ncbi:type VII secretion target [Goodfellowiella coeruleoviolacea]|uniref:Excreted virulence factor EspC, type VII ESX diderm n=1 Tax=Goodfellowiella coeruleoviolacea TaxID=334858 RepID=A0AAE3GJF8_9PSEU|nr:type VII secretion target [Goodfellowiella coeruleoviolacea]MCP2169352.1 Excreted virulence factor EspC, type VII ESX diderm [Goodfellowiella coeruleoviolacea]